MLSDFGDSYRIYRACELVFLDLGDCHYDHQDHDDDTDDGDDPEVNRQRYFLAVWTT